MQKTEIVETHSGKIQGYVEEGIRKFKGIPYAESPIGTRRFSNPIPKEPWTNVFQATEFSPIAPQPKSFLQTFEQEKFVQDEERCLTLNIWTPESVEEKCPVMFWIHGGDFVTGSSASMMYDGTSLAKRGNVVVVTINYRLGVLGYLNIPGVTANVGEMDKILALKWTNENIDLFGGDPENITIFGESAGSRAVITLSVMPAAKGLFRRVIAQSIPHYYASDGVKASEELMSKLGIKSLDIDALRVIPVKKLIALQDKIYRKSNTITLTNPWVPHVDGNTLLEDPLKFFQQGKAKDIDLLIGSNLDENKIFSIMDPNADKLTLDRINNRVNRLMNVYNQAEEKTNPFIETYIQERELNNLSLKPRDIYDNIATDLWFRILSIRLAEAQSKSRDVYMYLFTWESPALKGKLGAAHAVELPFVFGTLNVRGMDLFVGKGPAAEKLSEEIIDSWINFAKTGNPNHENLPDWHPFNTETRATMFLGKENKLVNDPFEKTRIIWDEIF